MREDTHVEWLEWGEPAFERAREESAPVMLSLTATWCSDCHEMDAATYGEPRIAAIVNDGFVPVRVDVDRHPRVRERYNMGGFPSTVFTTPSGELLTGATYLGPDGMRQVLDRVREMWDERGAEAGRVPRALSGAPTPAGDVTARIEEQLAGELSAQFDSEFAGWGTDGKFPLPRTIEFALKRSPEQAVDTLGAIQRNLFDDVDGGFYRFADGRDWSDPHHEKRLDANAALLRAFARGYLHTGRDSFRETADRTVGFLVEQLWNGDAFGASVGPADGRSYYELDAEGRRGSRPPRIDHTAYAGANALAADALLEYHAVTDDERARRYATRTLAYVGDRLVVDGELLHTERDDAAESGLLEDQARVAAAFGRAAQVLGGDYVETAREVAAYAVETLRDEGSFRDGPLAGPGLLDRPLRPIDGNAEMADALLDLAVLTGDESYREVAREAVGAFAGAWDRLGVQVAGYGAVASRLCGPTLTLAVGAEAGSTLHRAALRVADHEKVVVPAARDVPDGTAEVRFGDDVRSASTPDELVDAVGSVGEPRP